MPRPLSEPQRAALRATATSLIFKALEMVREFGDELTLEDWRAATDVVAEVVREAASDSYPFVTDVPGHTAPEGGQL